MPPALTAASGLDALTQAIESYISLNAHVVSRSLAEPAVKLLFGGLRAAFMNGQDREARTRVAEGSLLSGMAFSQSGLGAVHGLAHPMGLLLDLAHGLTCAILLPHILRWNLPVCRAALGELGSAVGVASAEDFVAAVDELCVALGIPKNFRAAGLQEAHFPTIVKNCRSGSMKANPRPMQDQHILDLLNTLKS